MKSSVVYDCECATAALAASAAMEALQLLLNNCCGSQHNSVRGTISLPAGNEEVKITTPSEPLEVYFSITSLDQQVCGGDIDMVGVRLLPDGFAIYSKVVSSEAQIKWVAYLS